MEKFTKQAAEKFISVLQQEENRCQIENNILNPMVAYIGKHLWPYIVSLSISLCFLLVVLAYLIYLTFHLQKDIRLQGLKQ
jgi:hypothetical protein